MVPDVTENSFLHVLSDYERVYWHWETKIAEGQ